MGESVETKEEKNEEGVAGLGATKVKEGGAVAAVRERAKASGCGGTGGGREEREGGWTPQCNRVVEEEKEMADSQGRGVPRKVEGGKVETTGEEGLQATR
jgi:hypothetical protein